MRDRYSSPTLVDHCVKRSVARTCGRKGDGDNSFPAFGFLGLRGREVRGEFPEVIKPLIWPSEGFPLARTPALAGAASVLVLGMDKERIELLREHEVRPKARHPRERCAA